MARGDGQTDGQGSGALTNQKLLLTAMTNQRTRLDPGSIELIRGGGEHDHDEDGCDEHLNGHGLS